MEKMTKTLARVKHVFSKVVPETWSLITPFIDDILDELYDHALAHETTAKLFAGHNIEGLKAVQKSHWELTFKNGFDASYEERAQRIGHSYARIGLAPNIFTDSYGFMLERLLQNIISSNLVTNKSVCSEKVQEITNVIFRDLSRVVDKYYQVVEHRRIESSQYVLEQSREFSHRMSLVSDDVQSVATAVDQMDSSISNISKIVDESSNYALAASDHIVTAVHQQSNASRDMSDRMRTLNSRLDRQVDDLKQLLDHMQLTIKNRITR